MPEARTVTFIPINRAKRILEERETTKKLELARERTLEMLRGPLKDFDMSSNMVLKDNWNGCGPEPNCDRKITKIVTKCKNPNEMGHIQKGIAFYALRQLGALNNHYATSSYYYHSPTLDKDIDLTDKLGFYNYALDPEVVFQDLPRLINEAENLTRQVML